MMTVILVMKIVFHQLLLTDLFLQQTLATASHNLGLHSLQHILLNLLHLLHLLLPALLVQISERELHLLLHHQSKLPSELGHSLLPLDLSR